MTPAAIPEKVLACIRPADRASLGVQTQGEAEGKYILRSEKELQKLLCNFLRTRGIWFDQDAMHKRRSGTKSAPDFQFPYNGRFVAWEAKIDGGRLDAGQERVRDKIISQGGEWRLITNLPAAMAHLDSIRPL